MNTIITFQDHGQDFITFEATQEGKIVDVQPFQFSVWSRYKIQNMDNLVVGGLVKLIKLTTESCETIELKYPIEGLTKTAGE